MRVCEVCLSHEKHNPEDSDKSEGSTSKRFAWAKYEVHAPRLNAASAQLINQEISLEEARSVLEYVQRARRRFEFLHGHTNPNPSYYSDMIRLESDIEIFDRFLKEYESSPPTGTASGEEMLRRIVLAVRTQRQGPFP